MSNEKLLEELSAKIVSLRQQQQAFRMWNVAGADREALVEHEIAKNKNLIELARTQRQLDELVQELSKHPQEKSPDKGAL